VRIVVTTKQLEDMPRLERMEYCAEKIHAFSEIIKDPQIMSEAPNIVEVEMVAGTCFGYGIFQNDFINISKWAMTAGSEFPEHSHEEREEIIVYDGCLALTSDGQHHILGKGDSFINEANVSHKAKAALDTKFITITVPCPKSGFPRP